MTWRAARSASPSAGRATSTSPASARSTARRGRTSADAPHPENAYKFINYILRPEVAASLTNKVFYANPNKDSKKFVKPEVANNPTVFLSDAEMKKMIAPGALNNDTRRTMTRLYTSFKTGL